MDKLTKYAREFARLDTEITELTARQKEIREKILEMIGTGESVTIPLSKTSVLHIQYRNPARKFNPQPMIDLLESLRGKPAYKPLHRTVTQRVVYREGCENAVKQGLLSKNDLEMLFTTSGAPTFGFSIKDAKDPSELARSDERDRD